MIAKVCVLFTFKDALASLAHQFGISKQSDLSVPHQFNPDCRYCTHWIDCTDDTDITGLSDITDLTGFKDWKYWTDCSECTY